MLTSGLLVSLLVAGTYAIVCAPNICDNIEQPKITCEGDVISGGGFCGCTDVCAGVDGDACELPNKPSMLLGVQRTQPCSAGYDCVERVSASDESFIPLTRASGACRKKIVATTPRMYSKCEQTRRLRMISFAIWRGQWTPKCYLDGRFMPKQCDNTGACFCVTPVLGEVVLGSKKQSQDVTC